MNKYQEYLLSQKKNKKDGTFIFMICDSWDIIHDL